MPGVRLDTHTFESPSRRLDLIFAHRTPLEEISGADFIYFNVTFNSFVLVQYKLLEKEGNREFFRLNDHMRMQLGLMEQFVSALAGLPEITTPNDYRIGHDACFWKFALRHDNLQTDNGLIPGYYLPLDLLRRSIAVGPRGGETIAPKELPRALSNTDFTTLVRDGWVGTTTERTSILQDKVRDLLSENRGVTIAVQTVMEEPA
jgi:hypothetical protein